VSKETANQAKGRVQDLLEAAILKIGQTGRPLAEFRGVALFDTRRDDVFTELPEFAPASEAIAALDLVRERFGENEVPRIALQFLYQLIDELDEPAWSETAFESLWDAFVAEVSDPRWTYRGVANLRNFHAETDAIELGHGVVIRGRNSVQLERLGFHSGVFHQLSEDWHSRLGASSFVLTVEETIAKDSKNFALVNLPGLWAKAQRAVEALRLLAPGDVSLGQMWVVRADRFDVGLGGWLHGIGFSIPAVPGSQYVLADVVVGAFPDLYDRLQTLASTGYRRVPGNFDLALRAFMATYDRWPPGADSRVLDSITSLEAVLGSGTETAFKLAFRVASLLSADDEERAAMLERMKDFYETRSAIVHGGRLKRKHQERLNDVDELRRIVRAVLFGLLILATTENHPYDKQFFQERLDSTLVDSARRDSFRSAMGFA
jgi:hypothetical protein